MNVTEAQRFDLSYILRNILAQVHKAQAERQAHCNAGSYEEFGEPSFPYEELSHIESLANGAIEIIQTARNTKDVG